MEAGLQVFNDADRYQIDSKYANLALLRKGRIQTQYDLDAYAPVVKIPLSPGEVVALSCSNTYCGLLWKNAAEATVFTGSVYQQSTYVDYWVFGNPKTTSSFGLQVFSSSVQLVFDSGWRPFNVVGEIQGHNTMAVPSGRTYAAVMLQQYWYSEEIREPTGGSNSDSGTWIIRNKTSAITTPGGVVGIAEFLSNEFMTIQTPYDGPFFNNIRTNSLTARHLVCDVTGY